MKTIYTYAACFCIELYQIVVILKRILFGVFYMCTIIKVGADLCTTKKYVHTCILSRKLCLPCHYGQMDS